MPVLKKCLDAWIELDNVIRRLQDMVREKKVLKTEMQTRITAFMSKHNVEDVDRKEASLRYRVIKSKKAPTKTDIKQRLLAHYEGDRAAADGLAKKLFEARGVVERAEERGRGLGLVLLEPQVPHLAVGVDADLEVAERLAAEPGGKDYGVPSVKVRAAVFKPLTVPLCSSSEPCVGDFTST